MAEAIVTRTRTTLAHTGSTPAGTGEMYEGTAAENRRTMLVIDPDVWVELGVPDTVTLTIEPGDLLNDLPDTYEPLLGVASTRQLLDELIARMDQEGDGDVVTDLTALAAQLDAAVLDRRPDTED